MNQTKKYKNIKKRGDCFGIKLLAKTDREQAWIPAGTCTRMFLSSNPQMTRRDGFSLMGMGMTGCALASISGWILRKAKGKFSNDGTERLRV
ncbi:MAG: hypothetical protein WBD99_08750 [Thermodesulfobacteriota bacterium]